jgi:electron transfer flavoprotein beta subunit
VSNDDLRIAILLRRLQSRPGTVSGDQVLGRCERAALAAGLHLRGAFDRNATVTVISMGPARREDRVLAVALRSGCDRAVRVFDHKLEDLDYLGTATVLAKAVEHIGADLLLCGDRAQDELTGAIGPSVAELLNRPHISGIVDAKADDGAVIASRRSLGKLHRFRCALPVVLCVSSFPPQEDGDSNAAATSRSQSIEELDLASLGLDVSKLEYRRKLLGHAKATRKGLNASIATSPSDLVSRMVEGHLLG